MRALLPRCFGIPAQGVHPGEKFLDILSTFSVPVPNWRICGAAALRALLGHLAAVIAGMADQVSFTSVQGQRKVAARAFQAVAALAAENIGGRAAPVKKQDGLLVVFEHDAPAILAARG